MNEMSKHFSAMETFAIYGESETTVTVTVVLDNLSTEEKTYPPAKVPLSSRASISRRDGFLGRRAF